MKKILLVISFVIFNMYVLSSNAKSILKFNIVGISGEVLASVTTRLQLKQETITKYNESVIKTFYRDVPQEILKVLELYGYFQASVASGVLVHKKDRWEKTFKVKLGPPVKITAIDLKITGPGAASKKIQQYWHDFPLKKGDVFRTDKYNDAKQFLFDLADTDGYINAVLTSKKVLLDIENNTAEITLHFDTGPRYYFGATTFVAPSFSQSFLTRFLNYKPNDFYSSKKVNKLQETFSDSTLFQKVTINPKITENRSHKIPLEIILTPNKAKQYNFGVGYGTDTGVRGSLGMEMKYLTPTCHSFKGEIQGSPVQNDLELHYLIPGKYPPTDLYDFTITGKTLNLDKGKSLTGQIGFGYITVLKGWHQTVRLSLQHEHYKLTDQPYESSTLLMPNINWLHNKSDHQIRPNKGHNVNINLRGATKYLGASTNFFQSQIDAKYLQTFFTRIQIILHAILGYTGINDINNLPLSLQFYTGGTKSIRGFGYNAIGPGRILAVGSVELRHRLIKDWYVATFFDVGNANDRLLVKPNQGAGVGIVWRTGIGTLELTYAKAISQPGTPGRIQFSLGAEL